MALPNRVPRTQLDTGGAIPFQNDPVDASIQVTTGRFLEIETGLFRGTGGVTVGPFPAVSGANKVRWDLVSADKTTGALSRIAGIEQTTPIADFTGAPGFPVGGGAAIAQDEIPICWVKVDEAAGVLIDSSDITDLRNLIPVNAPTRALQELERTAVLATVTEATADPSGGTIAAIDVSANPKLKLIGGELSIKLAGYIDDGGAGNEYIAGSAELRVCESSSIEGVARAVYQQSFPAMRRDAVAFVANTPTPTQASGALAAVLTAGSLFVASNLHGTHIDIPITVEIDAGKVTIKWGTKVTWTLADFDALVINMSLRLVWARID